MSAKKQITRQKIIDAAYELVRKTGMSALNARSLAKSLGCSTRPIYLSFSGMEELKGEVVKLINQTYQTYLKNEVEHGSYPEYKAYGMGYIRFAREERQLFSYLFMRNRSGKTDTLDGGDITNVLKSLSSATGLNGDLAERFHCECWVFVHGIATMLVTSYLDLDDEAISVLITDMFMGLKARYENLKK
ncbi:MAG: TetR/AcrR family transcriptional regulator [Candidatus Coproplasma sp.]